MKYILNLIWVLILEISDFENIAKKHFVFIVILRRLWFGLYLDFQMSNFDSIEEIWSWKEN
jgi:hypothetical protein